MYIVYVSPNIIGYCICWGCGLVFLSVVILKVCVDDGNTNASAFITWFDYNGLVIFEVVQCFLFLPC